MIQIQIKSNSQFQMASRDSILEYFKERRIFLRRTIPVNLKKKPRQQMNFKNPWHLKACLLFCEYQPAL